MSDGYGPSRAGYLAALASLERVGPARLRWMLALGDPEQVWGMVAAGRLPPEPPVRGERELPERWRRAAATAPNLPAQMDARMQTLGVEVIAGGDMPGFLAEEPEPPPVLFCSGAVRSAPTHTVAIVGTRRATSYGIRVARQLGRALSAEGVSVVSGLAIGIDAAAHEGALEAPTPAVAVVGAGHDRPCPRRNRELARRLEGRGLVVSEVPPGAGSAPWRFPLRNRLIASFAQVVVVVESAARGGSMSTVAEALVRNRAVMAVPGPLGRDSSAGCHELLRDGAHICTGADDVMALLALGAPPGASSRPARRLPPARGGSAGRVAEEQRRPGIAGPVGARVLQELAEGPLTLDVVVARCGSPADVSEAVAELEASDMVSVEGGWLRRNE